MNRYVLLALLPLAACATPQEQCIANSGRDIGVLGSLIASTQTNIIRGYGLRTVEFLVNDEQVCGTVDNEEVYCNVAVADTRQVPYAVDLNAEAAKLASLQTKRQELILRQGAVIAACKLQFPEV